MDFATAIEGQRAFFRTGATRSLEFRRAQLLKFRHAIESREKQLGLIDLGPDAPRSMRHGHGRDGDDDFGDDERGDRGDRAERPAAAPVAVAETDDTAGPAAAAPKADADE